MKYIYLLFSGGKDSMLCYTLLKEQNLLHKTKLLFIKTNAAMPEQIHFVEAMRQTVADIITVDSDVHGFIEQHGYPSDVVPVGNSDIGVNCGSGEALKICDRFVCCSHNIWKHIDEALLNVVDCEMLVIGEKYSDANKGGFPVIRTGAGMVPVIRPIYFLDDDAVRSALKELSPTYPDRFNLAHSSIDCWCCTAYWDTYKERCDYLGAVDQEKLRELHTRMFAIKEAVKRQIKIVEE